MPTENLKKAAKKEAEELRINFDEAMEEAQAKAIIVEFQGKEYKLPRSAPAWLPLFVTSRRKDGVLSDEDNIELIEGLLGSEFVSKIVDERENFVSLEDVNDRILIPVMKRWGMPVGEPEKKDQTSK